MLFSLCPLCFTSSACSVHLHFLAFVRLFGTHLMLVYNFLELLALLNGQI